MRACDCQQRDRRLEAELAAARQQLADLIEERNRDETRYRQLVAIVEASRDAIWSWTPDGIINSWNAEAERLLQFKAEEIIGKSLLVLVAPDRVARTREIMAKLLEGGWYEQYDTVRVRKDGVAIPVELTVSPIRDAAGAVIGAATVCRDITARKQQERALRESERRFFKLFDLAPIALSVSTLDAGRYVAVNTSLLAATGYAREEVVGHSARELSVYTDPADFKRIRQHLAKSQSLRGMEIGLRGKNGVLTALLSAEVIDLNGEPCLLTAVVDITERKQAEQTLAASEARLRAVLESLYDGVAAIDAAGKLVFVNDAMARLLGFASAAELPRLSMADALARIEAFTEDGKPLGYAQRPLLRALSGESVIDLPLLMRQPAQGREYEVFTTAIPVRDPCGNVTMAVVRMRDVTEQKKTLRALQLSQDRYAMAMRAVDAMVYDWDVANDRVERSDGLQRLLGFRPDEAEPTLQWWRSRIHPADRSATGSQLEAELADRRERHVAEYRIRHRDGHWIDIADRGIVVYDDKGKPSRVVGSTVDVTRSKQAQQALRVSEERYRSLVENANDIVATLDLELRFTSVNPAVERILGYTPEDIVGTPLAHYVPEDQFATHREKLARKLGGAAATQYEMQLFGKGRKRCFTLEVNSKLLVDGNSKPIAIHAIARDVTERKEAEARQTVLVRELQHRTKNMLAVIQAIASQTLARSENLASAQEALIGRLHALAHAQEFVAAGAGGGASLQQLVAAELAPFGARASMHGKPLVIGGAFAQTLALVVHELATNAIKHGALSAEAGRVEITWNVDRAPGGATLTFLWREREGPPACSPQSSGFGTRVLQMAGKARLAFTKAGFEYHLSLPLADAVKGSEGGEEPS